MLRLRTAATACVISLLVACVTAHVKMMTEIEGDARKHKIDAISAILTAKLPAHLKLLESRRRMLQPSADGLSYMAADVEALLLELERPLLGALEDDDVSALRDLIADKFAQARKELNLPRAAASQKYEVGLAAFRWAGEPSPGIRTVDRASTESTLAGLRLLLQRLLKLAADRDLVVDLCVVTQPPGKFFYMNAPSLPERQYATYTTGRIVNVSRGLYAYLVVDNNEQGSSWKDTRGISHKDPRGIQCLAPRPGDVWTCPAIDLWDDPRPVLDCDFSHPPWACRRRNLRKGECEEAKP